MQTSSLNAGFSLPNSITGGVIPSSADAQAEDKIH